MNFPAMPNTNNVIVNTQLTKIKVILVISFEWPNLDYPCYPVGRPHVAFPVTTNRNIPWVEFVFTAARICRLHQFHFHTANMVTVLNIPSHAANKALYIRGMNTRIKKIHDQRNRNCQKLTNYSSNRFLYISFGYVFVTKYRRFYFQIRWLKYKVGTTTLHNKYIQKVVGTLFCVRCKT